MAEHARAGAHRAGGSTRSRRGWRRSRGTGDLVRHARRRIDRHGRRTHRRRRCATRAAAATVSDDGRHRPRGSPVPPRPQRAGAAACAAAAATGCWSTRSARGTGRARHRLARRGRGVVGVAPRRCASSRSSCSGNAHLSTGEVLVAARWPAGRARCCGRTSRRGGTRLQQSPWVADAVLSRVAARLDRGRDRRAAAAGDRPARTSSLVLVDADGVVIDEFGPQYADVRPADHRWPGAAERSGPGRPCRDRGRALTARLLTDLSRRPRAAREGVAGGREPTRTNVVRVARRGPRAAAARRPRLPTPADVVPRPARRRCARGSARWTTWTCGSARACSCGRPADRTGSGRSGPARTASGPS